MPEPNSCAHVVIVLLINLMLPGLAYVLMKLDWKRLLEKRKLKWRRPVGHSDRNDAGPVGS